MMTRFFNKHTQILAKRLILLITTSTLALSLAACGNKGNVDDPSNPNNSKVTKYTAVKIFSGADSDENELKYYYFDGMGVIENSERGEVGYLGEDGEIAIKPQYASASDFYNGYALVKKGEIAEDYYLSNTVIDKTGKEMFSINRYIGNDSIAAKTFRDYSFFSNAYGIRMWNDKFLIPIKGGYQLFTIDGTPCFNEPVDAKILSSSNSDFAVWADDKSIFVTDESGKKISDIMPTNIYDYYENDPEIERFWDKLMKDEIYATTGSIYTSFYFDTFAKSYNDGIFIRPYFKDNGEEKTLAYEAIDQNGNRVFENDADYLSFSSEGLISYLKDGKWGYMNTKGETVIEPQFDGALPFSDGLAAVALNDAVGFIDSSGKLVIPYKFTESGSWKLFNDPNINCFMNGLAVVGTSSDSLAIIDKAGNIVFEADKEQKIILDSAGFATVATGEDASNTEVIGVYRFDKQ